MGKILTPGLRYREPIIPTQFYFSRFFCIISSITRSQRGTHLPCHILCFTSMILFLWVHYYGSVCVCGMRIYHLNTSKNAMKNKFYARKKNVRTRRKSIGSDDAEHILTKTWKPSTVAKEHKIIARAFENEWVACTTSPPFRLIHHKNKSHILPT